MYVKPKQYDIITKENEIDGFLLDNDIVSKVWMKEDEVSKHIIYSWVYLC